MVVRRVCQTINSLAAGPSLICSPPGVCYHLTDKGALGWRGSCEGAFLLHFGSGLK